MPPFRRPQHNERTAAATGPSHSGSIYVWVGDFSPLESTNLEMVAQTGIEPPPAPSFEFWEGIPASTARFRVRNTCLYQGPRADRADRAEAEFP